MYEVERTDEEVNDLLNEVKDRINEGGSRFPGQTYEEGIREALMWVFGEYDDHPYPEE